MGIQSFGFAGANRIPLSYSQYPRSPPWPPLCTGLATMRSRSRLFFRPRSTAPAVEGHLRARASSRPRSRPRSGPSPSWAAGLAASSVLPSGFVALDAELPGAGWPLPLPNRNLQPHPTVAEWRLLAPATRRVVAGGGNIVVVDPPKPLTLPGLKYAGLDERHLVRDQAESLAKRLWLSRHSSSVEHRVFLGSSARNRLTGQGSWTCARRGRTSS